MKIVKYLAIVVVSLTIILLTANISYSNNNSITDGDGNPEGVGWFSIVIEDTNN